MARIIIVTTFLHVLGLIGSETELAKKSGSSWPKIPGQTGNGSTSPD